jgi:hypothetical protein
MEGPELIAGFGDGGVDLIYRDSEGNARRRKGAIRSAQDRDRVGGNLDIRKGYPCQCVPDRAREDGQRASIVSPADGREGADQQCYQDGQQTAPSAGAQV